MNKQLISTVNVKDPKQGKNGLYWSVGLKINGKWYNGFVNSEADVQKIKDARGKEVDIVLFQQKAKDSDKMYDNWKWPTQVDLMDQRIHNLEQFISLLCKLDPSLKDKYAEHTKP